MRGINFQKKKSSFKIMHKGKDPLQCWTYTTDTGLLGTLVPNTQNIIDDWYVVTIDTENEDYWFLYKWGDVRDVIMVGAAEVLVWYLYEIENRNIPFKQLAVADGTELKNEFLTELKYGFYYGEPAIEKSICIIDDSTYGTLSIPYITINCNSLVGGNGEDVNTDAYFSNVGYNLFGFLGEKHSYFNLDLGIWVEDQAITARASDIGKAICHKYDLVWDDRSHRKWIGNYVKYIRSYDENIKRFRLFKCGITPLTNEANFELHTLDEAGNYVVRGISLLLIKSLETIDSTDGAMIHFK